MPKIHYRGRVVHRAKDRASFHGEPQTKEQLYELTKDQISTILQQIHGIPVLFEHGALGTVPIGEIVNASVSSDGSGDVTFRLLDTEAGQLSANLIEKCGIKGLSLSHNRKTLEPVEVSLCIQGARPNTGITGADIVQASIQKIFEAAKKANKVEASDTKTTTAAASPDVSFSADQVRALLSGVPAAASMPQPMVTEEEEGKTTVLRESTENIQSKDEAKTSVVREEPVAPMNIQQQPQSMQVHPAQFQPQQQQQMQQAPAPPQQQAQAQAPPQQQQMQQQMQQAPPPPNQGPMNPQQQQPVQMNEDSQGSAKRQRLDEMGTSKPVEEMTALEVLDAVEKHKGALSDKVKAALFTNYQQQVNANTELQQKVTQYEEKMQHLKEGTKAWMVPLVAQKMGFQMDQAAAFVDTALRDPTTSKQMIESLAAQQLQQQAQQQQMQTPRQHYQTESQRALLALKQSLKPRPAAFTSASQPQQQQQQMQLQPPGQFMRQHIQPPPNQFQMQMPQQQQQQMMPGQQYFQNTAQQTAPFAHLDGLVQASALRSGGPQQQQQGQMGQAQPRSFRTGLAQLNQSRANMSFTYSPELKKNFQRAQASGAFYNTQ